MKSKLKHNFVLSIISLLLINGFFIAGTFNIFNYDLVQASSNWTLKTDSDFENGTLENLSVIGFGNNAKLMIPFTSNWYKINSEDNPEKRCVHGSSMIYGTDNVLVYGGYGDKGGFDDTWIYDLSDNKWIEKSPKNTPLGMSSHSMAPIFGTDKVIAFGGSSTWEYDLSENNWTEKKPNNYPSPRSNFAMTSVYNTDKIILFGGEYDENFFGDTWEYDLSDNNWTKMYPKNKPDSGASHSMANIYGTDKIIKMGGYAESSRGQVREIYGTMIYDLSENNWTFYKTEIAPDVYTGSAMAEIYNTDRVLLFSGDTGVGLLNETWVFDLTTTTWTQLDTVTSPPTRSHFRMIYDSYNDKSMFFGGDQDDFNAQSDTWIFDYERKTWSELNCTVHPSKRWSSGIAYNSITHEIILCGGMISVSPRTFERDTWIFTYDETCECFPEKTDYSFLAFTIVLLFLGNLILIVRRRKNI